MAGAFGGDQNNRSMGSKASSTRNDKYSFNKPIKNREKLESMKDSNKNEQKNDVELDFEPKKKKTK